MTVPFYQIFIPENTGDSSATSALCFSVVVVVVGTLLDLHYFIFPQRPQN